MTNGDMIRAECRMRNFALRSDVRMKQDMLRSNVITVMIATAMNAVITG